jgi:hypothetical protein
MKRKGYDGEYRLEDPMGIEVHEGMTVINFRGDTTKVLDGSAPHREGTSGYVATEDGRYYATIYDLTWVKVA